MSFKTLTGESAKDISIRTLGLNPSRYSLESPEALATAIRRAASFMCPTDPQTLIDSVIEVLAPLSSEAAERENLKELLEQIVSTGDLLELATSAYERQARMLYLGPPSFIQKAPGKYLVTGIRPEGVPLVSDNTEVDYAHHTRSVSLDPQSGEELLQAMGLHKITLSKWIGQPSITDAHVFVEQFRQRLNVARASGSVDGLSIIDPSTRVDYYRGRWRAPTAGDDGLFVGRRPQAFGADLWCVVHLADGNPEQLVDLPIDVGTRPGRDDAWRLQAAIDASNSSPQRYRISSAPNESSGFRVVDFFSPLPTWGERHLELIGSARSRSRGALFSYLIPLEAVAELGSVLAGPLWMIELAEGNS